LSERDQKLEKESDINNKVSLFFIFRSGLEAAPPCIRFSISIVPSSPDFLSQRTDY